MMKCTFDIGNLDEDGGWAVSLDVGPLSMILGDLVGEYGLRIALYIGIWAYYVQATNRGLAVGRDDA